MSSSSILFVILVLALLVFLLAGVGLLVFVLKRQQKGRALPHGQAGPGTQAPVLTPPASQPPSQVSPAFGAPHAGESTAFAPPPAPPLPPPPAAAREGIDPALLETQRSDDRKALETNAGERNLTFEMHSHRPGSSAARDQASFETVPSASRDTSTVARDMFATTPNVSTDESDEPAAQLRAPNGAVVRISATVFRLGRHPDCQYVVPTPGASRQHAEIRYQDHAWIITDLSSGNGTYVNGVRIRSHQLAPGDEVRIDQTLLTFDLGD